MHISLFGCTFGCELGAFSADISLMCNSKQHYVSDGSIKIGYYCSFDVYDEEFSIDDYHYFSISCPAINVTDEGIQIPAALIFLTESSIRRIVDLISDENIEKSIQEAQEKKEKVDNILT